MSLINYFIQVNLYMIVFYCFYKLLLDKETYFALNRFYLTGSVAASFVIPLLRLEWLTEQPISRNLSINIQEIVPKAQIVPVDNFSSLQVLSFIYIAGILFSFVRLICKLIIVKKNIVNPDKGVAFSFFGYKAIDETLTDYNTINIHEEAHIKQMHSVDVLFLELVSMFTWFNPVIYLYKSSIRIIHEFLADKAAADFMGDKKEYALLLLSKALNVNQYPLANSFFKQSLIKKRVFMLQKQRSGASGFLKYALIIPLLAGLIVLSSATFGDQERIADPASVDQKPEFPGGFTKLSEYLIKNVKYPPQAIKAQIEGKVVVSFVVDRDGSLKDIKVLKSVESSLDAEALRVMNNCPAWLPGSVNGKPARVQFSMPLNFKLPSKK